MSFVPIAGLEELLRNYRRMSVTPLKGEELILKGFYDFSGTAPGYPTINDSYQLEIRIPKAFPKTPPSVYETEGKIPQDGKHHVNSDGTLCLASPLRLRWKLAKAPTLIGFAQECLTPYLYGLSHKFEYGTFPFGELAHGKAGVIADYLCLFSLKTERQVENTLKFISLKKRIANKKPCPCGCGKRLGICPLHFKINTFRKIASRSWFGKHLKTMGTEK